ncbi:hypothetical protein SAICODRAFT_73009 [Saitoella complicata NRRL Y-17804]|uniref:Uncharacterized protein n=1 Tax=Saitoella complicata (strain BCRC 22490 / CBS 7301 / JCM 7358 / NBRC 10748 / NRRL Y-17804) TaxID=698492 RepID=A0A0E9NEK2_SAICN|nr:uncharacterized protein SAICODRAFT_73009 [Saitoella complicata NRRL Y-17804]ODQ50788.1 hypothetical protein SAICODRAFT_73009 [Saitoella complicata NRRL Y-17804]GAO48274.1 hypothetical protein G7K_2452-t1 [Saitoella complicata NRRL Y-17804]
MTDPFNFSLWDKGKGLNRATSLNVGKTPSEVKRKVGRVHELRGTGPGPVKSSIDDLLGLFDAPDAVRAIPPIEIRRELTPTHAPTLSANAESAVSQAEDDDDEFGEFVDSPVISQGSTFTSPVVLAGATFPPRQFLPPTNPTQPFQSPLQSSRHTALDRLSQLHETQPSSFDLLGTSPVSTFTGPAKASASASAVTKQAPDLAIAVPQTTTVVDDDNDDFGDFISTPTTPTAPPLPSSSSPHAPAPTQIPPAHILLPLLFRTILFLPSSFFASLAKLPYPLRRRVLADPRTKRYFSALVEGARIAARIVAGRYRYWYHTHSSNETVGGSSRGRERERDRREERDLADLEARRVKAEWDRMRPRLRAVIGGMGLVLPDIQAENIVGDLNVKGKNRPAAVVEVCAVCGLGKREILAGIEGDGRGAGSGGEWREYEGVMGHAGCVNWWVRVRNEV